MKKNNDELLVFSKEHLYYEIWMLYEVAVRLALQQKDKVIANALIESFGIHSAILLDFLCNQKKDEDDAAIAAEYVFDNDAWRKKFPSYYKKLKFIYWKRNKELVHLSYERLNVSAEQKLWNYVAIAREISCLVDEFIDLSDKSKLSPEVINLKGCYKNYQIIKNIHNLEDLPLKNSKG